MCIRDSLTADGVTWRVLRKSFLKWSDVEALATRTYGTKGIRSVRMVGLVANGKHHGISCSKRNFTDVVATCSAMIRAASDSDDASADAPQ